ncbi:helix-turn-helix domain-containing protein [Sulfitobacter mediterraneus]|uniref:helix-turn-helix domain-containing protein n=1 Tax=Sulfitobacter mediterraneus TaxID=83219 RepID=UPI0021A70EF2|nr:helix-turn-helix domain-containing protein [Sulfitobacter mediterraneus]UWR13352.1 helix-turn-helix domain-containing protein [Sulfitobacter mediterraneus]
MRTIQGKAPAGARSLHIATKHGGIAQNKWQLLRAIEEIREPLGLKGTSISLLRAMISFLRVDQVDAARDDGHICFASNASLAKRVHVSIQTVERHIAKLVSLGLLTRKSSGNGKRWARRDRRGNIVLATGLSLLPLAERYPEFVRMAQDYQDQKIELGRLRDMCSAALTTLKAHLLPEEWEETLVSKARSLLRRQPDKMALTDLLAEITVEISKLTSAEPIDLRGTAPEIEGHKETSKTQYVEEKSSNDIEVKQDDMERAYPRLCAELKLAKNQKECQRLMDDIAGYLSLGNTWFAIKNFGPALSFMILGYLLERTETISNHRSYAFKLSQDLSNKSLDWRTLLKRPKSN